MPQKVIPLDDPNPEKLATNKDIMKTFVNSWVPKLIPQLEQTKHRRMLSTIEALQQQHPLFEVMEQVRA